YLAHNLSGVIPAKRAQSRDPVFHRWCQWLLAPGSALAQALACPGRRSTDGEPDRPERAFSVLRSGVRLAPLLEIGEHRGEVGDVDIAPRDVAQVVAVRLLLDVADAVLGNDRAIAMAEAVDGSGTDAAAGIAAGDDDGVDALLVEVLGNAGIEEDRRALL